jgi:hypothetical protein
VKQTIFSRVAQLAKANINDLLDRAEDPQKMLDQMVRDYSQNIREAEAAVAQTIGTLRMAKRITARPSPKRTAGATTLSRPPAKPRVPFGRERHGCREVRQPRHPAAGDRRDHREGCGTGHHFPDCRRRPADCLVISLRADNDNP